MTIKRSLTFPNLMGHILENFVVTELKKQVTWNKTAANLYHFRTSSQEEFDVILELGDGRIIGIEVKATSTVTSRDIKGLSYLQEQLKDRLHRGIVLYAGNESVPLGRAISALPISSLWSF